MGPSQASSSSILQDTRDLRRRHSDNVQRETSRRGTRGIPAVMTTTYRAPTGGQEQRWAFFIHHSAQVSRISRWQQASDIWGHLPSCHASFICEHMESLSVTRRAWYCSAQARAIPFPQIIFVSYYKASRGSMGCSSVFKLTCHENFCMLATLWYLC